MKQVIGLGKVAGSIEVDVAKLRAMPQVEAYIFNYGLKQMLNDVHASEKEADKKLALSQKKLDSLYRGEVAQSRAASDPVGKLVREMAEADLVKAVAKLGKKAKDYDKTVWAAQIDKLANGSKAATYRAKAEEILAIKVADDDEIDIEGLELELAANEEPEGEEETGEEPGNDE